MNNRSHGARGDEAWASASDSQPAPKRPRPAVRAAPFEGGEHCSANRCREICGWRCAYVDATDQRCATSWCEAHGSVVDRIVFCRRHAVVVRAIATEAGTLREIKTLPKIGDRAMSLAILMGEELDAEVLAMLRESYGGNGNLRIAGDQAVRGVWRERSATTPAEDANRLLDTAHWRQLSWEWHWGVSNAAGFVKRIVLGVPVGEPPEVVIRVDRHVIFSGVPDWIDRRARGDVAMPEDRANFKARLLARLRTAVAPPDWLPGQR